MSCKCLSTFSQAEANLSNTICPVARVIAGEKRLWKSYGCCSRMCTARIATGTSEATAICSQQIGCHQTRLSHRDTEKL